ncbi:MAG: hypothetical protein ACK5H1_08145 [Tenacibaculum sp.]
MIKFFFILSLIYLVSCKNEVTVNSCFQNSIQPITVSLNSPQLNGLLTPNGTAEINGGISGIVLFNRGSQGSFSSYVALDRKCPNSDCAEPMILNPPILECPCDKNRYNMLNGSLISGQNNCEGGARLYTVTQSGSTLQISN